jgi:hypothetical protein
MQDGDEAEQTPMALALVKRSYSLHPWRIVIQRPEGALVELPHCAFARKRDGVPTLTALQALDVPWHAPFDDWPLATQRAVWEVLTTTEGYRTWAHVVARGSVAPG